MTSVTVALTLANPVHPRSEIQIEFPDWNPNAPDNEVLSIVQGGYTCRGLSGVPDNLICSFSNGLMTISDINEDDALEASDELEIQITGIRNPISTSDTIAPLVVRSVMEDGGIVDETDLFLIVETPADIGGC